MEIGSVRPVASGDGFGFVSRAEYIGDERITRLPIIDAEIFNDADIMCLPDRIQSRMIVAFLDVTKIVCKQRFAFNHRAACAGC